VTKQQQRPKPKTEEGLSLPLRQHVTTTSTVVQRHPATGEWEEVSKKIDVVEVRGEFPGEESK
jgi:hypothetical protein